MKKLLLISLLFLLPNLTHAAIARDGVLAFWPHLNTSSYDVFFTASTTGDVVLVSVVDNTHNGGDTISGVTYGGSAMTLVASVTTGCTTGTSPQYLFKMNNVSAGGVHIVASGTSSFSMGIAAVSFSGVDTTDAVDSGAVVSACDNNAPTVTLTSNQSGDWYYSTNSIWNAWPTAISGATCLPDPFSAGCTAAPASWSSEGSIGAAGSYNFAYTSAAASDISHIDILLKPGTAATVSVKALFQRLLSWF